MAEITMNYEKIDELLKKLKKIYVEFGASDVEYKKSKCATKKEVEELERKLNKKLPTSLKDFFLNFSKELYFNASFPDNNKLKGEFDNIFSAHFEISFKEMIYAEESRREWVEDCFGNIDDEYDKVWHNKLGFISVPNGDIIAFDILDEKEDKKVVYLSHDDGEGHGLILGRSFINYLESLILVGGCGNEDWQTLIFCPNKNSGIDPFCDNAEGYREIISFNIE